MAAKLEVVINGRGGKIEFYIERSGDYTPRDDVQLMAIVEAIKAAVNDFDAGAAKCDCPECQQARGRERERKNLH